MEPDIQASAEPGSEPAVRYDAQNRRLCGARRTNGEPCRAPAMNGQRVCRKHGGGNPAAKRNARIRLMELVDPAVATLAREMVQADKSVDRQRAANSILDRAGVPRVVREVSEEDSRDLLFTRLRELRENGPDGRSRTERTVEQVQARSRTSTASSALADGGDPGEYLDAADIPGEGDHA